MVTKYIDTPAVLDIAVLRGDSRTLENFARAKVAVWLVGKNYRWALNYEVCVNHIVANVPTTLKPGVYALEVVWVKNDLAGGHDLHHHHLHEIPMRSVMRARKDELLAVTEFAYEADGTGRVTLNVQMMAASYGYDGLDAYEKAYLVGKTTKSEEEWLDEVSGSSKEIEALKKRLDALEKGLPPQGGGEPGEDEPVEPDPEAGGKVYYGAAHRWKDVTECRTFGAEGFGGEYEVNVTETGMRVFVLVPEGYKVKSCTMSGFTLPMEAPENVEKGGKKYKMYASSNEYKRGTLVININ